ncbi:MAG: serine hydrolase domain-containing protein [Byssovorax sp.]
MSRSAASLSALTIFTILGATLAACAPPLEPAARAPSPPPPTIAASSSRLSRATLAALTEAAFEADTDALVVLEDGKVVLEYGEAERPFELMSVTKSVVSLVIGQLVDEKLVRLDQPMTDFIPAWKGTPKAAITLRHILAHTSGLDDKPTTEDIYASDDFVKFAIDAELKHPPGERFSYSNRASNLLAAVVKSASGTALDERARARLFEPIGVRPGPWSTDKAGNVQVMAGLHLRPVDLARLGQLVLDEGRFAGRQIVSSAWIQASAETYQDGGFRAHGLLWWIDPEERLCGFSAKLFDGWRSSGVPEDFIAKLRPLEGKYFGPRRDFFRAVDKALSGQDREPKDVNLEPYYQMTWKSDRPDCEEKYGPVRAVVADGWGGQLLIVYPKQRVVVARLRDVASAEDAKEKKSFLATTNKILWGIDDASKK